MTTALSCILELDGKFLSLRIPHTWQHDIEKFKIVMNWMISRFDWISNYWKMP